MEDFFDLDNSNEENESSRTSLKYFEQASAAQENGDTDLAIHLYVAAFNASQKESKQPCEQMIKGLKLAWSLAVKSNQQSLAEYVFECLKPYLSTAEMQSYGNALKRLAFSKLKDFGFSPEDIDEMSDSIIKSLEQMGFDAEPVISFEGFAPSTSKENPVAQMALPFDLNELLGPDGLFPQGLAAANSGRNRSHEKASKKKADEQTDSQQDFNQPNQTHASVNKDTAAQGKADSLPIQPIETGNPNVKAFAMPFPFALPGMPAPDLAAQGMSGAVAPAVQTQNQADNSFVRSIERFNYKQLSGFETAVREMRNLGIGLENDSAYRDFIDMLNERHGFDEAPSLDTLMFRSPAREDAEMFMEATFGELSLPGVRMYVEENAQGQMVLCVMAQKDNGLKLNAARNEIIGKGVLILSNIDMWGEFLNPSAQSSRACDEAPHHNRGERATREAMHLIQCAVENPDVYVLVSASMDTEISHDLIDLLGPITVTDIDYPSREERAVMWTRFVNEHPSIDASQLPKFIDYSANLSRYEIGMVVREALEAAYKNSLIRRRYLPVSTTDLFERLASCHAFESNEYEQLEQAIVDEFSAQLKDISTVDELFGLTPVVPQSPKKAAKPAKQAKTVELVEPVQAAQATQAVQAEDAVKKPKRRVRKTKTDAQKETEALEASATTEEPVKPKRARRKKAENVDSEAPEQTKAAEEKPKRTRRKKADAVQAEAAEAGQNASMPVIEHESVSLQAQEEVEQTPKPKRTRTRKAKPTEE